jgi:aminoglycoside phosphotransferase (APT) family kinase protein
MTNGSDTPLGRLLAHGRAADVYEVDDRRVLRRYRRVAPFATEREARLIEHVRAHGFPTPRVYDANETDLVLERVDGPTMVERMTRRPWTIGGQLRVLAALHDQLHAIPAPAWLDHAPMGGGDSIVHLDLHPLNVLLSPSGPMVIDWTNAGRGSGMADVVLTWLLLRTGVPDDNAVLKAAAAIGGRHSARRFIAVADPSAQAIRQYLDIAARYRLDDPNLLDAERRAIQALLRARR